jgi:hypothetical protein
MRRILLVFLTLIAISCAGFAQEILYRDTATFMWDAITVDMNGDPLLPTDVVEYDVWIDDGSAIDNQDPLQLSYIGRTALTELLITFPTRVTWAAGVQAIVTPVGGPAVYSPIAWSTEAIPVTQTGPFYYVPVLDGLDIPRNLRDSLQ